MPQSPAREKQVTLLDLLDRILYRGVVIYGDITLSVADVDLVYLSLRVLLTSVQRADEMRNMHSIALTETLMAGRNGQRDLGAGVVAGSGSTLKIAEKRKGEG